MIMRKKFSGRLGRKLEDGWENEENLEMKK